MMLKFIFVRFNTSNNQQVTKNGNNLYTVYNKLSQTPTSTMNAIYALCHTFVEESNICSITHLTVFFFSHKLTYTTFDSSHYHMDLCTCTYHLTKYLQKDHKLGTQVFEIVATFCSNKDLSKKYLKQYFLTTFNFQYHYNKSGNCRSLN